MKPLLLLLASSGLATLTAQTVGKLGDIELKTADVRESIAGLEVGREDALVKDPAALNQYVKALLVQRHILKQAQEQQLDQDPAVIARLVRARETALAEAYIEKNSAPGPDYPSAAELTAAYEGAKDKLLVPKSWHLAQIFIAAGKDGAEARLADVKKQLATKGADFSAIAKTSSEEPASAAQGGDIGWLTEAQIQPEIRQSITALKVGTFTQPIQLKDGWHILALTDVREAYTPTLDQIRGPFTARLRAEKAQYNRQQFIAQILKDHPPAINEIELGNLVPR
jgi:parvulin-like peptidyl-prolyl isomerase